MSIGELWLIEGDFVVLEKQIQSQVFDVADSVKRDLGSSFGKKNRFDCDFLNVVYLAEIVHIFVSANLVKRSLQLQSRRAVMVAMNGENRQAHLMVSIHVVGVSVVGGIELWYVVLRCRLASLGSHRVFYGTWRAPDMLVEDLGGF